MTYRCALVLGACSRLFGFHPSLDPLRGKPRPSGRGRIARILTLVSSCAIIKPPNRTTAGLAESNASGDMSSAIRHSAQEPAEAIPQNQRDAVGIPSLQEGEDVKMSGSITTTLVPSA